MACAGCGSSSSSSIGRMDRRRCGSDSIFGTDAQGNCRICLKCLFFWIAVGAAILLVLSRRN